LIAALLSLLLLGQTPHDVAEQPQDPNIVLVEYGRAVISSYVSEENKTVYKIQIFSAKNGSEIFEQDTDSYYFNRAWDIVPDGYQLASLRPGAHIKLTRYQDVRNNRLEVLDNFDDEALQIAMYSFLKPPLSRDGQIVLKGLANNRFSLRETLTKKMIDRPRWDILSYCINSKDVEVKSRFWRIFDSYTLNKPFNEGRRSHEILP
jgi:hypothetical protein